LYGLFGVSSCAFFILAYQLFRDEGGDMQHKIDLLIHNGVLSIVNCDEKRSFILFIPDPGQHQLYNCR